MRYSTSRHAQRGVTLVVGLIMLVLITLIVTTAFTLSTTNLKSVGNMQLRNEAIAAANIAIDAEIGTSFINNIPAAVSGAAVDINDDTITDYIVDIDAPVCVRATTATNQSLSSVTLGPSMSSLVQWNTVWDFNALATNAASGAAVRVREGARVLISGTSAQHLHARCACGITTVGCP
jgi:Tfp pilus assembly protein PilX